MIAALAILLRHVVQSPALISAPAIAFLLGLDGSLALVVMVAEIGRAHV